MVEPVSKTKAEIRAERRAKQEAQRAAKALTKEKDKPSKIPDTTAPTKKEKAERVQPKDDSGKPVDTKIDTQKPIISSLAIQPISDVPVITEFAAVPNRRPESNRVHLFRHLKEPDRRVNVVNNMGLGTHSPIHVCFLALGVQLDESRVFGANEVCLQFLAACERLLRTQPSAPPTTADADPVFARHFGPILQRHVKFISLCHPLAVTVRNAYQYLKQTLSQLDSVDDWSECQTRMLVAIDEFRQTSIYLADTEIAERASVSIRPGDCVCTLGYSSIVVRVLQQAWTNSLHRPASGGDQNSNKVPTTTCPFSVLVVDTRPKFEGRRMLARLTALGIPCEYTHIGALPNLCHKISLAIMGAHALLNNGYVLARIGTAQMANIVSQIAHAPTLVCAETYKFWERAHSDAFEYNELGDPDDLWRGPRGPSSDPTQGIPGCSPFGLCEGQSQVTDLRDWRSNPKLRLLHLAYDVLPPELVSAVVTEKGTLPTTSVPVVLRVKQASTNTNFW